MPCIFCLAVFMVLAGALSTVVLDQLEAKLTSIATEPVVRSVDSESVIKFETSVAIPGSGVRRARSVPVSVTIYKKHKRVRIQVMTHDLTRAEAEAVEDLIAAALELRIVNRSDAHDEQKVREAFGETAAATDRVSARERGTDTAAEESTEAEEVENAEPAADTEDTEPAQVAEAAPQPSPPNRPRG